MGELYNSERIVEYCLWYQRRKISEYHILDDLQSASVNEVFQSNIASNESSGGSAGKGSLLSTMPQKSKIGSNKS